MFFSLNDVVAIKTSSFYPDYDGRVGTITNIDSEDIYPFEVTLLNSEEPLNELFDYEDLVLISRGEEFTSVEDVKEKIESKAIIVGTAVPENEIEKRFKYHAPKEGQPEKYEQLRNKAKELAYLIEELCPNSREKSVAMTELETAIMWANASIARN